MGYRLPAGASTEMNTSDMCKIISFSDVVAKERAELTVGDVIGTLSHIQYESLSNFCETLITLTDDQIKAVRYIIDKVIEDKDQL